MELLLFFLMMIMIFLAAMVLIMVPRYMRFSESNYQFASGNDFFATAFDKGNYGEFLTFSYLEKLGGHNRLMTNLYLPKEDGGTTEVDLIMISQTGIYVFESKNYSGWIFGDEKNRNWTQTLPNNQKNRFFNPIWQNKGHISALKSVLGIGRDGFFKSYIIFSERCELKKICTTSQDVKVLKRDDLAWMIRKNMDESVKVFTTKDVDRIYIRLRKYTCASDSVKKAHVDSVEARRNS